MHVIDGLGLRRYVIIPCDWFPLLAYMYEDAGGIVRPIKKKKPKKPLGDISPRDIYSQFLMYDSYEVRSARNIYEIRIYFPIILWEQFIGLPT